MDPYIIANTPCGVYRGDLPFGYAYYQTLLDIHARFLRTFEHREVICHKYSLNILGKRAEGFGLDGTIGKLDEYARKWIGDCFLRDRMGFSFEGSLLDTEPRSIEQTRETFIALHERGYILRKDAAFYLDAGKIGKDFDLNGIAQEINFFSARSKKEFLRVIAESSRPIRITKDRIYSIPNPFGSEGIAPIFGVANLWDGYFDHIDLMVSSEKELTRYLVLRFLSRIPISERLPMQNILVFNYIDPEYGAESWDIERLTGDACGSDSLRYAFAKSLSLSRSKTGLAKSLLEGGRRLANLVENLGRFFLGNGLHTHILPNITQEGYFEAMSAFRYSSALTDLEIGLKNVSRDVDIARCKGNLDEKKLILFERYLTIIKGLSPFFPSVCKKVMSAFIEG
ncbi:MAG: hypothetical protein KBD19_02895 [Candidatus Moranbacteria bacterium]|nr:hypothetical protein [Candidatus Moranbacteria bacterium]